MDIAQANAAQYMNSQADPLNVCFASTSNVSSGNVTHSQLLFTAKGSPLNTAINLIYQSLNIQVGPLGKGWSHSYQVSLTVNSDGSVFYRGGDGERRLYNLYNGIYVSPRGDFSSLVKNNDNSFTITYRDGLQQRFHPNGKLSSIVDRYLNSISLSYWNCDPNEDLIAISDSNGRITTLEYDQTSTPHKLKRIIDPSEHIYDFDYEGGLLSKVIHPAAGSNNLRGFWQYTYNADGLMATKRDPNNNVYSYNYLADYRSDNAIDPNGLVDPSGHTRTQVYNDESGAIRTTTFIEKDGSQWLFRYDIQSALLMSKTDPNGKITSYTYYANGLVKSKTEPYESGKRVTTFFSYDAFANLTNQTEPLELSLFGINDAALVDVTQIGTQSSPIKWAFGYTYDNSNKDRITSISDLRSTPPLVTSYVYSTELDGEVVTITSPVQSAIVKRNPNGSLRESIDGNGKLTSYSYYPDNQANREAGIANMLKTITGPDGITTNITEYDRNGNAINMQTKDKNGNLVPVDTSLVYDALNRLKSFTNTSTSTPPAFIANVTSYDYDYAGNRNLVVDAEERATTFEHNYLGQVTRIIDAQMKETRLMYSGAGCSSCGSGVNKLTAVRDAKHVANGLDGTIYQYDQLGRLEYETDPLGKKIYYTYYDNGLVKGKYDATSSTPGTLLVSYKYNNRGQLLEKLRNNGSKDVFIYRTNGQLATATTYGSDGTTVQISYTYDYYDNGRLKSITDNSGRKINYDLYDGLGQREQVTILKGGGTDERVISYDYDAANHPWKITSSAGTFEYLYDELGRRNTLTYPNGTTADWDFDDLNRLTAITHKVTGGVSFAAFNYTDYDKVGNRKTVNGSKNESYLYDELYRLLTVTSSKPEAFDYDAVGNRSKGPGTKDTVFIHDDANRMTQGRKLSYGYDNAGNQTTRTVPNASDKTWAQSWDAENRLVKVEKIKGTEKRTVTFKYDPFGRRIEKKFEQTVDGITKTETTSYVYDNDNIAAEIFTDANSNTEKTFFTHGATVDEHLALERNGSYYYYHADGLGSIVSITDTNRNVVQTYEYDSFGMAKPSTNFRNSYAYTGREWDKETGTYYYRARTYDPMDGRFISKDPIGFYGGDVNLYSYVQNNPVNYTDPTGQLIFLPFLAAGGYTATMALADLTVAAATSWWISRQVKTPNTGTPGSWNTNPNSGQERKYGPNGNPEADIDWNHDHGAGSPHGHNWEDGKRGPGVPLSPWPQGRKPCKN